MNSAELLAALQAQLATVYPASRSLGRRPGKVSVSVVPARGEWDDANCDPWPVDVRAEVSIQASDVSEKGAIDLLHHVPAVAGLIRQAGFRPESWTPEQVGEVPAVTITAVAHGEGG